MEDGSEAHPFRIETWSELKNIASLKSVGATTYVMIMNDIEIPADEYIEDPVKNFVISGTEEGVRLTVSNATESNGNLFEIVDDTIIRNITYDMGSQLKAFICSAFGDVTLENIILEGNIEVRSNNETGFVIYGNWYPGYESVADCNITFINCVNKADFNDVVGNCYGAPFISFTWNDGTYKTNLIFDGCSNEGDLFYGQWASILIGNAYLGMEPGSVIIRNGFTNTGRIGSFLVTAFVSHNDTVEDVLKYDNCEEPDLEGQTYLREREGLSFAENSWNVTSVNDKVVRVGLLGRLYIGFFKDGTEIEHAANYTLEITSSSDMSGNVFTMAKPASFAVIGSRDYTESAPEDGTLVTKDGNQYWYVGETDKGLYSVPGNPSEEDGIAEFTKYYLAGYDADGNAIVMVELAPEKLPQN